MGDNIRKRIKLKRKIKLTKSKKLIYTVIFSFLFVFFALVYIGNKITPILINTAEIEANKFSTIIINNAVSQIVDDKIDVDEIFVLIKNDQGEIQTIDFNPTAVNHILNVATTVVQENLKLLENGNIDSIGIYDMDLTKEKIEELKSGVIEKIPIGIVTGNTILSNLGPKIPIKLKYIGDVNSNITTKIEQYGINNAMVKVGLELEMTARVILPFFSKKIVMTNNMPVAIKIIQGKIPNYYSTGIDKNSNLYSLPIVQ